MTPKVIELRPNRLLLNPEFNGYKLSLEKIPIFKQELETSVDRVLPNINQYSLLHAKLFGLHNHLIGETLNEIDIVYYIDKLWQVKKIYLNQYKQFCGTITCWKIPRSREYKYDDYNVSLKFATEQLAVISDGVSKLYILQTGDRLDDLSWNCIFAEEVLGSEKSFIIQDVVCKTVNNKRELHCLLLSIQQENEGFESVLHWISLSEATDKTWGQISIKQLQAKGAVYYSYLERTCEAVYVISDNSFKFTIDSDNPIIEKQKSDDVSLKQYIWTQTKDDLTIKLKLPINFIKQDLRVHTTSTDMNVTYKDVVILNGKLFQRIDDSLTTWTIQDQILEITLCKSEVGLMWSVLLPGNENGEYVVDPILVEEIHDRLAHLCNDNEVIQQMGSTFNSEQVEECDFEEDKCAVFQRLCCLTHDITHQVNINSHKVLLTAKLTDLAPAIGLRHNVDACLWQPSGSGNDWTLKHEGTLNAFGYVQASKQQRKFSECAPDLSYSVICESSRHIFIYRQEKPVTGAELRQRTTGRKVAFVAQQQVTSLTNDEILGIYAASANLFLLTQNYIYVLKL